MQDRFTYYNAMPVACFGTAHKKGIQVLCNMDIVFCWLLRSIVGPPGALDWTLLVA